jgi:hypothetical protein
MVSETMLSNLDILLVTVAAVSGTLFAAALGWLDSGEPFNGRKFTSSILHAVVAGILIAVGNYALVASISVWDLFVAFLSGAGVDVVLNRAGGAIAARADTKPASTQPH